MDPNPIHTFAKLNFVGHDLTSTVEAAADNASSGSAAWWLPQIVALGPTVTSGRFSAPHVYCVQQCELFHCKVCCGDRSWGLTRLDDSVTVTNDLDHEEDNT